LGLPSSFGPLLCFPSGLLLKFAEANDTKQDGWKRAKGNYDLDDCLNALVYFVHFVLLM
jgi:hypothetical protein